jgi:hypothetical protein
MMDFIRGWAGLDRQNGIVATTFAFSLLVIAFSIYPLTLMIEVISATFLLITSIRAHHDRGFLAIVLATRC